MDLAPKLSKLFESDDRGDAVMMVGLLFAFMAYLFLQIDRRRDGSPARDDQQIGLKVLLFTALAVSVLLAAGGARQVLAFILGGFKGGWKVLRGPLAVTLAGGGVGAAVYFALLPRTNYIEKPQTERLMVGMAGVWLGGAAIAAAAQFLSALLAARPWSEISDGLASIGVNGGVALLLLLRLGVLSGWRSVPRVPPMPMAPPMTGYPPHPGGPGSPMPPLGGGYPPQGGGWPGQ